MSTTTVSLDDIRAAADRIEGHVIRTPVVECPTIGESLGCTVAFKCENLQHVGAFKARGACNAVFSLTEEQAAAGVVAHSSGNHAAALARAAKLRGIEAHIVMPHNSAKVKVQQVRSFGVEPSFCEPTTEARQAAADVIINETGATLVHPYDDAKVIAGQGTTSLEVLEQCSDVDTVVIPVGGGGLLAGSLTAIKALRPDIQVIAAEPEWANDTFRSWKAGTIQRPKRYDTIGDGLRTMIGSLTFPIINELVDDILTTSEEAIAAATRTLFHKGRLVCEPSGAVPLAVMTEHANRFAGRNVVGVISGGNLDLGSFSMA
ncbi:MAG: threonine/serine dehydratase [Planctomycetaceae bacterium]